MKEQKILSERIKYYCRKKRITYYALAYRSTVPLTTLMHIVNCTTKNPEEFSDIEFEVE